MDGTSEGHGGGGKGWELPEGPGAADPPPILQQAPGPWGDHRVWTAPVNVPAHLPVPPSSMRTATKLMYLGAGLSVLSLLVFFATIDQFADTIAEDSPWLSQYAVDAEVDRQKGREAFRTFVGVGLWIWMAVKNGQGRKWARVVGTIFGVISLLGTVAGGVLVGAGGFGNEIALLLIIGVVEAANALAIMILFFRQDASEFYNESERWKASRVLRGY